jgi:hypothetical protein
MFCRDRGRHRIETALAFAVLAFCLSLPSPAFAQPRLGTVGESVLAEAADRAEAKLNNPSCRLIFSDFRTLKGRLLQETLDTLGQSAQTYFRGLVFYDGYGQSACWTRDVLAFTRPGSRAVFVCSAQFVERAHREPGLAAALLIHEELHALGLGENPPASKEITARVIARCGK